MSIASSGLTSLMIERTGGLPLAAVVSDEAPDPNYANGAAIIVRADRPELSATLRGPARQERRHHRAAPPSRAGRFPPPQMVRKGLDPEAFFSEIRVSGYPMTRIVQEVKVGRGGRGLRGDVPAARAHGPRRADRPEGLPRDRRARRQARRLTRHSTELYPNWFFSIKPFGPHVRRPNAHRHAARRAGRTRRHAVDDLERQPTPLRGVPRPAGARRQSRRLRALREAHPALGRGRGRRAPHPAPQHALLARLASHRARALEKAMDEKLRAELAAQQNAVQIESLTRASAVGLLSSMVAHELKQPLTVIGNYAGSLRRRLSRGEVPHETLLASITEIEDSGTRAAAIIDRVRSYGQVRTRSLAAVDLSDLVKTAVARWRRHSAHRVPCTLDLEPGLTVEADRLEIELAVLNIVKNAAGRREGPARRRHRGDAHGRRRLRRHSASPTTGPSSPTRRSRVLATSATPPLRAASDSASPSSTHSSRPTAARSPTAAGPHLGGRGLVGTVRLPLSGAPEDRTAARAAGGFRPFVSNCRASRAGSAEMRRIHGSRSHDDGKFRMRAKQSSSADRPNCGGAEMVPGHCSGSHRTGGRGRGQRLHAASSSFLPPPRPSESHSHSISHMRKSL